MQSFIFPPLKRLLEECILQSTGGEVNLVENSSAKFKAIQENTLVVVSCFDLRTQSYHEKVLKAVFGVSDYLYRYEFAKSRGQIHCINSAGERTDSHTSCCTKLVRMVVIRMIMQLDLAIKRKKTLQ